MRRLLVILIPLLIGAALGVAHYTRAEGRCAYGPADVQLEIGEVIYDGSEAPLLGVPSTAVFEQPPNDMVGFARPHRLLIQGRSLDLTEAP